MITNLATTGSIGLGQFARVRLARRSLCAKAGEIRVAAADNSGFSVNHLPRTVTHRDQRGDHRNDLAGRLSASDFGCVETLVPAEALKS